MIFWISSPRHNLFSSSPAQDPLVYLTIFLQADAWVSPSFSLLHTLLQCLLVHPFYRVDTGKWDSPRSFKFERFCHITFHSSHSRWFEVRIPYALSLQITKSDQHTLRQPTANWQDQRKYLIFYILYSSGFCYFKNVDPFKIARGRLGGTVG